MSCSKQLFVASLRCWLYFSPVASICQPFFVHFVIFLAAKLCKPQNIVQFEFSLRKKQKQGVLAHAIARQRRRALSHFAVPGQNAGRPLQFYDFDFFFAANMVC